MVSIAFGKTGSLLLCTIFSEILSPRGYDLIEMLEDDLTHFASQTRRAVVLIILHNIEAILRISLAAAEKYPAPQNRRSPNQIGGDKITSGTNSERSAKKQHNARSTALKPADLLSQQVYS